MGYALSNDGAFGPHQAHTPPTPATVPAAVRAAQPNPAAEAWARLRGVLPLSLCDWPGKTSCVLFLGGCSMHCPTCHNHQLAWRHETLPAVPRGEALALIGRRVQWLDGITVTGGEPTEVPGIDALLAELKTLGPPVKLDTNGLRPEVVERLLRADLVDVFAVDVKGPFDLYMTLTGGRATEARARIALERIFLMAERHPRRFYFRTTWVPSLLEEDIETVRGYLPEGFDLRLQDYQRPPRAFSGNGGDWCGYGHEHVCDHD